MKYLEVVFFVFIGFLFGFFVSNLFDLKKYFIVFHNDTNKTVVLNYENEEKIILPNKVLLLYSAELDKMFYYKIFSFDGKLLDDNFSTFSKEPKIIKL